MIATVLLVGYGWLHERAEVRQRGRYALTGMGASVALAAVLLAYPAWFFLALPGAPEWDGVVDRRAGQPRELPQ